MLESDVDKNRGNSTFGDDTVNNPGRSTVTKIETDTSCPQFDGVTDPGYVYSDESNVEIDIITTGQLPSQPNFSIDPLATDSPINQQQSNLNANDCDSSPSILDQQDQPLKRNNEASTFASKNARFIKRSTFYQFVKINGRTQRLYRKSVKTKASMKIGSIFVSKMKKSIVSIERIMFKNGTCILKNSETNTRMFLGCHQVGVRKLFSYLTMKWKLHELMMLN